MYLNSVSTGIYKYLIKVPTLIPLERKHMYSTILNINIKYYVSLTAL